ncbi:MAG: oxidoreductase [Rhodobacterales bacterium]|nr:MAG: oxidoreductase [Rhodobacterales bacterium]
MTRKILILNGHPKPGAFCDALAKAAAEGATGSDLRQVALCDLRFDPNLRMGYDTVQELEPDLEALWRDLEWCDHLILVHPLWWGSAPALLKGAFDRLLLPGRAYLYEDGKPLPKKLLEGRTANVILTADTPGWYFRLVYRRAWLQILRKQILGFCGIRIRNVLYLASIRGSTAPRRARMLEKARALGRRAAQ